MTVDNLLRLKGYCPESPEGIKTLQEIAISKLDENSFDLVTSSSILNNLTAMNKSEGLDVLGANTEEKDTSL